MSLLEIISDPAKGIAPRLGITAPSSLFGSTDPNAPLLISIAQEEGEELARRHDWQALVVGVDQVLLGATLQSPFPADFDRFVPYTELFNSDQLLPYVGPVDNATWTKLSFYGSPVIPGAFIIRGNNLYIQPVPTAGQKLTYFYLSKNFVRSGVGVAKAAFTADTDTTVLPERLLGLGIIWRWKKDKGFAYAEHMATYEREVERAASRDRGPPTAIQVSKPRPSSGISSTWPGRIIV